MTRLVRHSFHAKDGRLVYEQLLPENVYLDVSRLASEYRAPLTYRCEVVEPEPEPGVRRVRLWLDASADEVADLERAYVGGDGFVVYAVVHYVLDGEQRRVFCDVSGVDSDVEDGGD